MPRNNSNTGEKPSQRTHESNNVYTLCVYGIPNGYAWQNFKDDLRETGARACQVHVDPVPNDSTKLGSCAITGKKDAIHAYNTFAPKNLPRCVLKIYILRAVGEESIRIQGPRFIEHPPRVPSSSRKGARSGSSVLTTMPAPGVPMSGSTMNLEYQYAPACRNYLATPAFPPSHHLPVMPQPVACNPMQPTTSSPPSVASTRHYFNREFLGDNQHGLCVEQRATSCTLDAQSSQSRSFPRPQAAEFVPANMRPSRQGPLIVDGSKYSSKKLQALPDSDDEDADNLSDDGSDASSTYRRGHSI